LDTFQPLDISGYVNIGKPIKVSCDSLIWNGSIEVQNSIYLHDELTKFAASQHFHPLVVYPYEVEPTSANFSKVVTSTWARLSGSSVWLEEYQVYLSITRFMFSKYGIVESGPDISFLKGQIYDRDWNHQEGYNIIWKSKIITFPTVFDVGADWDEEKEGEKIWYGPEDPRILIEEGVEGAEPVIVFNMKSKIIKWKRGMWIFRPFSGYVTPLTIRGQDHNAIEKNWAPFFHNTASTSEQISKKLPSQHIHFVYAPNDLRILYCSLISGDCDMAFTQEFLHKGLRTDHTGRQDALKGGTNFVPIKLKNMPPSSQINAWVSFPRTHIDACEGGYPVYRPALMMMINIGSQYFLKFASGPLDFGGAIIGPPDKENGCGRGRILIANSIARWEHESQRDVMTITFSVDDRTVQVARVTGIQNFLESLPWMANMVDTDLSVGSENFLTNTELSAVGNDVEWCAVESATNHTRVIAFRQRVAMKLLDGVSVEQAEEEARREEEDEAREQKEEANRSKAKEEYRGREDKEEQERLKLKEEKKMKKEKAAQDRMKATQAKLSEELERARKGL
jgi:beta-1,2-mannosyltransferase